MIKIGLTGGIGSGKSTISNLFAQLGVTIIDTDQIAHQITQPDQTCFKTIIEHVGTEFIQKDGSLNRRQLRQYIFKHPKERQWLEQTLHPVIRKEMKQQILNATEPYCLVVVPLLVGSDLVDFFDRILVVEANESNQIARTTSRDQTDAKAVKTIIESQSSAEQRQAIADDILYNNSTIEALTKQVEKLHQTYLKLSA